METGKTATEATAQATVPGSNRGREGRRRRWQMSSEHIRYFLPKPGSSPSRPELGTELKNEGEALVEAFKTGQNFLTVVAWKAVPEMNGDRPEIVKQVVPRT
jgi:hypothetical protein